MKKHNCYEIMEELRGCSICSSILKGFREEDLDRAIKNCNWAILEQKREISKLKKRIKNFKMNKEINEERSLGEEAVGGDI